MEAVEAASVVVVAVKCGGGDGSGTLQRLLQTRVRRNWLAMSAVAVTVAVVAVDGGSGGGVCVGRESVVGLHQLKGGVVAVAALMKWPHICGSGGIGGGGIGGGCGKKSAAVQQQRRLLQTRVCWCKLQN